MGWTWRRPTGIETNSCGCGSHVNACGTDCQSNGTNSSSRGHRGVASNNQRTRPRMDLPLLLFLLLLQLVAEGGARSDSEVGRRHRRVNGRHQHRDVNPAPTEVDVGSGHRHSESTSHDIRMLSPGQIYVMNEGDSVILECEFDAKYFHLFDNPVVWRKTQRDEEMDINLLGYINEPFNQDGRIEVSYIPLPPRYRMELALGDLSREDSGNYTCEVKNAKGRNSDILATVTHYIFVRASTAIHTYITNGNESIIDATTQQPALLEFVEHVASTVRCMTHGGYPPPEMLVYLGDQDITQQMVLEQRTQLTGKPGMRIMSATIERWSHNILPLAEYDGRDAQCIVTVPGMVAQIKKVKMAVKYAPIVKCKTKRVKLNEKNVSVKCDIKAKPSAKVVFWIIDVNGTTVREQSIVDNRYWAINRQHGEGGRELESKLFIKQVHREDFRTYTLIAENDIATTTQYATLSEKYRPTPKPPTRETQASKSSSDANQQTGYTYLSHGSGADGGSSPFLVFCVFLLASITVVLQNWPDR